MKQIRIFGIALLVAFLSLPLDVLACDNFKAKVDAARQAVKVAKKRYDGYNAVYTVNVTVTLAGGSPTPLTEEVKKAVEDATHGDILEKAKRDALIMEKNKSVLHGAYQAWMNAQSALASAIADYDNCVELTNKVNNVKVKLPCGIHEEGTPGNHKKVLCPTDSGRSCDYDFYYACTPHTHAYSGPKLAESNGGSKPLPHS